MGGKRTLANVGSRLCDSSSVESGPLLSYGALRALYFGMRSQLTAPSCQRRMVSLPLAFFGSSSIAFSDRTGAIAKVEANVCFGSKADAQLMSAMGGKQTLPAAVRPPIPDVCGGVMSNCHPTVPAIGEPAIPTEIECALHLGA